MLHNTKRGIEPTAKGSRRTGTRLRSLIVGGFVLVVLLGAQVAPSVRAFEGHGWDAARAWLAARFGSSQHTATSASPTSGTTKAMTPAQVWMADPSTLTGQDLVTYETQEKALQEAEIPTNAGMIRLGDNTKLRTDILSSTGQLFLTVQGLPAVYLDEQLPLVGGQVVDLFGVSVRMLSGKEKHELIPVGFVGSTEKVFQLDPNDEYWTVPAPHILGEQTITQLNQDLQPYQMVILTYVTALGQCGQHYSSSTCDLISQARQLFQYVSNPEANAKPRFLAESEGGVLALMPANAGVSVGSLAFPTIPDRISFL